MSLGENIKAQRIRLHLSQEYVADQIGVSRQAVSKWENDQSAPTSGNLAELAALFDVSISELIEPEKFLSVKQAERDRASESYRNRKLIASRVYGYMAFWIGYQCFRYSGNGEDSTWMKAWGSLIFLTGFVFVLISSKDYHKRAKFTAIQIVAGMVFLFSAFVLTELIPNYHGINRLLSAVVCGICIWFLYEHNWKQVWPYDIGEKETFIK